MQCPVDQVELVMTERQGVEIDYCPRCRGVWLDRGELDKIIERAGADVPEPAPFYPAPARDARHGYRDDHDDDRHDRRDGYRKRKRKSVLEDLFDFGF
ncbi:MAG TPA: zf-TFIIB domain-containing protein [Thermomicrobiales bacterium]|nr:zf-TFIIB domain-containing protein [Thermomicrobiales bacterium]